MTLFSNFHFKPCRRPPRRPSYEKIAQDAKLFPSVVHITGRCCGPASAVYRSPTGNITIVTVSSSGGQPWGINRVIIYMVLVVDGHSLLPEQWCGPALGV